MTGASRRDAVGSALEAVRHAINVTSGSIGPNHPMERAGELLEVALAECVERGERALETAIRDLAERFRPYGVGSRLLSFSAVETLERFIGRTDVLYLLSLRSTKKPPSRAQPLPVASRSGRSKKLADGQAEPPSYSSVTGLGAEIDRDIYEEVLGIFAIEAKEQLQLMGGGLRRLEADPDDYAAKREVARRLTAMKGSSALVGVENVRLLSHAAEDLMVELMGAATESVDLALLGEVRGALESLAVGDEAERSAIVVTELVERVVERTWMLQELPLDSSASSRSGSADVEIEALPIGSAEPEQPSATVPGKALDAATVAASQRISDALLEGGTERPSTAAWEPDQVSKLDHLVRDLEETRVLVERRRTRFEAPIRELRSTATHVRELSDRSRSLEEIPQSGAGKGSAQALGQASHQDLARDLNATATGLAALDLQLALATSDLDSDLGQMRRLIQRLKEHVGRLDQVSLEAYAHRFRRSVARLAEDRSKDVELQLEGFDVSLDQKVAEVLGDVLLHLLKNAVDHGIESPALRRLRGKPAIGSIRVSATKLGPRLFVEVCDDGAGLNLAGISEQAEENDLVPGTDLTSAQGWAVATRAGISTLEGRDGVGLDLVAALLARAGAKMSIDSVAHRGTTVRIQMPTDLTLTRGLVVERLGKAVALPSAGVLRVQRMTAEPAHREEEQESLSVPGEFVVFRGQRFEILDLATWLGGSDESLAEEIKNDVGAEREDSGTLLLLEHHGNRRALRVDRVRDAGELAVYPAGPLLERLPGIIGFALGEGEELLPVVDPVAIACENQTTRATVGKTTDVGPNPRVLVVDDVASVRRVVGLLLERLGASTILASDGELALRLLNEESEPPLMALIDLEMPGMNGLELTTELRARGFTFPIYLFTSPSTSLPSVEDLAVEGYVFKPLVRRELGALLRRHRPVERNREG